MRLDGFTPPTALPARSLKPVAPAAPGLVAGEPASQVPPQSVTPRGEQVAKLAEGEYLPASQGRMQHPVQGYANQALASYQSMASLPDADVDGVFGVDVFV